jgi:hypothetical protein
MLTDQQVIDKYGQPGDESNLTIVQFPYPMRIAWDLSKTVLKSLCHKLVKDNFTLVMNDLLSHYGIDELRRLEIDIFGGLYNFRKMRGGNKWSRHSWAIAWDLNPVKNGLKTKWAACQFSKPEYKPLIDIHYSHGFFSYGKERDFDAMHFEINQ